jgi:hypothetical protein
MRRATRCVSLVATLASFSAAAAAAQDPADQAARATTRLHAEPAELTLRAGESASLVVTAFDAAGNRVDAPLRFAFPRAGLAVADGTVTAHVAGEYTVIATVVLPPDAAGPAPSIRVPVRVLWPAIARVEIDANADRLFTGTSVLHSARALHADGSARPDARVSWSSSDAAIATIDEFGYVTAHAPGEAVITAGFEDAVGQRAWRVAANPTVRVEVGASIEGTARTGDVVTLDAVAYDAAGRRVDGVPFTWSLAYLPPPELRTPSAPGLVTDGRFVADLPGRYTVIASAGAASGRRNIEVEARDVLREFEVVGRGQVNHVRSSDHWIFEGLDGRDYAITGTWVADGYAYMWDVTDPGNIIKTDSIHVDARTVNDVKVSPDGRYAVMTREGASNRRNGAVILDLAVPAHPKIAAVFDEGLTGGVHNSFPTNDYLYALSAGEKYLIIDVRDIYAPRYVGEYAHPNARIHDVWVDDGIAYSAQWDQGVVVVDVGNGRWGGTPERPVLITKYRTPGGRTHTAVPYRQQSTGRLLVFASDEIMNRDGMALPGGFDREQFDPATGEGGRPMATSGYTHIIDFTDIENPRKIARYNVPEHGTHNMWIEDDILYQGYFESGVRIVDVSGELMGNLYTQGREMAVFKPFDPQGWIPNAPFTWGAQLHKGHVFFTDGHSGLWAGRVLPRTPARPVF